jgi:ankyrin repeat protein
MNSPPPIGLDNPIIAQFKPVFGQWELDETNIKRINLSNGETILHNYCKYIDSTPLEIFMYLIETLGCDVNTLDKLNSTALHEAFRYFKPDQGDSITVFNYLLGQKIVNVNAEDIDGCTLLHLACLNINTISIEIFKDLIETRGADINLQDNGDYTPIHFALQQFDSSNGGDISVLTYLISQTGFNPDIKGENGSTLLHFACQNINVLSPDVFKLLIETIGLDVNVQDGDENTPIHIAIDCFDPNGGDINVLNFLLTQNGVNVNSKGQYGCTSLHRACLNINKFQIDLFKLLVEIKGADVNLQDEFSDTPVHVALRSFKLDHGGDIAVLNYLLTQTELNVKVKGRFKCTLLHEACQYINTLPIEVFEVLIDAKCSNIYALDEDNDTPIHIAFKQFDPDLGNIAALTYLLGQKDVNVNTKDEEGLTLLHWASYRINNLPVDAFKCLIETKGADINVQDNANNTPIQYALHCFNSNDGDITALIYLLSRTDLNVNIKGENGCTLLHLACEHVNTLPLDIFQLLIGTQGADVNVQEQDNDTPAHIALHLFDPNRGNIAVLTYLLGQSSLNVNLKGKHGCTLIHEACGNINNLPLDIFKLLVETKSAHINVKDNNDNTPLCYALHSFKPGADITVLTYLLSQPSVNVNTSGRFGRLLLHWACTDLSGCGSARLRSKRRPAVGKKTETQIDLFWSRIVEIITQRCLQQVSDEAIL